MLLNAANQILHEENNWRDRRLRCYGFVRVIYIAPTMFTLSFTVPVTLAGAIIIIIIIIIISLFCRDFTQ
jgi:hypothetical protein